MKKIGLDTILGILLLAFAASASAADVRSSIPVSKDANLNAIVQEHVESPAYQAARIKPTDICASDGKAWACASGNTFQDQPMLNVDGVRVANTLDFGRLDSRRATCMCEIQRDGSWKCRPAGCSGLEGAARVEPRINERVTTPRDQVSTPRPE